MATEVLVSAGSPAPEALLRPTPQALLTVAAHSHSADTTRPRLALGGILVDQLDLRAAMDRIREFVISGRPHQVVTVNLDFLSIAANNPVFRTTLNAADLAVADGMPLVWLSRFRGQPLAERVAGVELVMESCRLAAEIDGSVFLLGAAPGVADAAGKRLQELNPGLRIAGAYSPPVGTLSHQDNERIVRMIRDAAPDFLFVALGAPRQDLWIREHLTQLQVPVAMGVGCVLDLLAGSVRRAPTWMQRYGLEWAFRLGQEPHRSVAALSAQRSTATSPPHVGRQWRAGRSLGRRLVIVEQAQTAGLSGDHGWNEADERAMGGVSTTVLLAATALYWGAVWLLSGLPPLPLLATRNWRNNPE